MGSAGLGSSDKGLPNFVSLSFISSSFAGVVSVSGLDRFYRVYMGVYFFRCFTSSKLITCNLAILEFFLN